MTFGRDIQKILVCHKLGPREVRPTITHTNVINWFSGILVKLMPRNSAGIRTYKKRSSPNSTVIDGVNRMHICDFILVIKSYVERIAYRFRDIDV